jgi:uncharacterized protein YkwD
MKIKNGLAAALVLALVSACGGSGGGGAPTGGTSNTGGNNGTGTSPPTTVAPVTSVAAPTYVADSQQALAYQQTNAARGSCGFGLLAQATQLDTSASAHANYLQLNGVVGHTETVGQPGFTGVDVAARVAAAGYTAGFSSEELGPFPPSGGDAGGAVRFLLAAPYHADSLLGSYRDVGFGTTTVTGVSMLVANVGVRTDQQRQQPTTIATYPCDGTTNAVALSAGESPSPFPNAQNQLWGQPITVHGPTDLRVTSATITGPSGSVAIQAIYGEGQSADPNYGATYWINGRATIIPAQLTPNTRYTVTIRYTSLGIAGAQTFSFTTGAT